MMVGIPYGLKNVNINFRDIDVVLPKKSKADGKRIIKKCTDDLKEFLDENVIYIVNDNQRPTKTKKILENIESSISSRLVDWRISNAFNITAPDYRGDSASGKKKTQRARRSRWG